jgi:hypothetical protein
MEWETADKAQSRGYGAFNDCPHLCIDVPDGMRTLTCRTSDGEQVTFAFVPYRTGGAPDCIDIYQHTSKVPAIGRNINEGATAMNVRVFSGGSTLLRDDERPVTLMCLILKPDATEEDE